jgi:curli biogenesis system outer membrane secretion channel CsgG
MKTGPKVEQDKKYPPKPRSERLKVGVMEFEDRSNYGRGNLGTGASTVLGTELFKSQQFRVFEREKIDKVLGEQQFQHSGAVDATTAVQIGKIVGLDCVVFGAVTKFGFRTEGKDLLVYRKKMVACDCTVDVRVVDVKTGELLYADQGDGTALKAASRVLGLGGSMGFDQTLAEDSLRAAIVKLLDNIVDQLYQ